MVMIGVLEITADAGMCVVSWSLLELDGSSNDNRHKTFIRSFICVVYCMDYCSPIDTTVRQFRGSSLTHTASEQSLN